MKRRKLFPKFYLKFTNKKFLKLEYIKFKLEFLFDRGQMEKLSKTIHFVRRNPLRNFNGRLERIKRISINSRYTR